MIFAEKALTPTQRAWRVALVPPFTANLPAPAGAALDAQGQAQVRTALWALRRWGVSQVRVAGAPGAAALLREAGLNVVEDSDAADGPAIIPAEAALAED